MRKNLLLLFLSLFFVPVGLFSQTVDIAVLATPGTSDYYNFRITDPAKREVALTHGRNYYAWGYDIVVPGKVTDPATGLTYTVTGVDQVFNNSFTDQYPSITLPQTIRAFPDNLFSNLGSVQFNIPDSLQELGERCFMNTSWTSGVDTLRMPPSLYSISSQAFWNARFGPVSAAGKFVMDLSACSKLKELGKKDYSVFQALSTPYIKDFLFPEGLEGIYYNAITGCSFDSLVFPSTLKGIMNQMIPISPGQRMRLDLRKTKQFVQTGQMYTSTLFPVICSPGTYIPENYQDVIFYLPADMTVAYKTNYEWSEQNGQMLECLTIPATGFSTYYLENENFEVPDDCIAYIVTGVQPGAAEDDPMEAVVKSFGPGSILPAKTAFILRGSPNKDQLYQAYVWGTEEDVTGNLLVGTAVEREFSEPGYKFYVFGKGVRGQGFYPQGIREGKSISLKPHKAGLRLPESLAPAKGIRFRFEELPEALPAGLHQTEAGRKRLAASETYDLQGRRVNGRPTRGFYIRDGRKTIVH